MINKNIENLHYHEYYEGKKTINSKLQKNHKLNEEARKNT